MATDMAESIEEEKEEVINNISRDKNYQHNHHTLHMSVTYPMILYKVILIPSLRI